MEKVGHAGGSQTKPPPLDQVQPQEMTVFERATQGPDAYMIIAILVIAAVGAVLYLRKIWSS